uniref:Disintegrin and metalloproteinase domain-containing protein 5-like n=1 Tax=Castor canadensis TaxID=51338 RepID=A0A8B7TN88_CASCN
MKNCTHPNCCDPKQCRLKGKAACGSGECCTNACKLKPANTLCRKSVDDECDFVEFCNGKDPHCVPDTHARDGHHCDSGQSYCYQGICRIFDKQCKRLFGR